MKITLQFIDALNRSFHDLLFKSCSLLKGDARTAFTEIFERLQESDAEHVAEGEIPDADCLRKIVVGRLKVLQEFMEK